MKTLKEIADAFEYHLNQCFKLTLEMPLRTENHHETYVNALNDTLTRGAIEPIVNPFRDWGQMFLAMYKRFEQHRER